ncbi:MAG: SpoIID/LytB domain-containing protein [Nitrospirae bacterium]|nr:SpoIID/LytB domain-containing protein [Nitrospirota bacterium]
MTGYRIKIICLFVFFIFSLSAVCYLLSTDVYADTIRVLILDEDSPRIPAKDEPLKKVSKKIKGDFLANGVHYTGDIEVWKGKNGLYVINEIPFEEYVKSVVMAEVGTKWEMEALKAQAVISRTYAVYQKNMNGNPRYHITSSVLHQVYKGNSSDAMAANAVEKTSGEILTFNGNPIEALYHSTSGGKTELPEEVFGKSYPYIKSVETSSEASPYWIWERKIPLSEIEKSLNISGFKDMAIRSYTSTGRVKEVTVTSESGERTIKSNDLREQLGWQRLPSTNFTMTKLNDSIIFEGKGYGHGVGLCQWSALEMAKKGKNYREILSFFYPGTEIQLYEGR